MIPDNDLTFGFDIEFSPISFFYFLSIFIKRVSVPRIFSSIMWWLSKEPGFLYKFSCWNKFAVAKYWLVGFFQLYGNLLSKKFI